MVRDKQLYDTLGVSPNASPQEIRKAYLLLSRKYHPDKESDPSRKAASEEKFKEISRANEVLSDPELRARYDRVGLKGLEEGGDGPGGASDIFSAMFGGGGGGRRREPKPRDVTHRMEISLADAFKGRTQKIAITRSRHCGKCKGSGTKSGVSARCQKCNGQGAVVGMQQLMPGFVQQVQMKCPACKGRGTAAEPGDICPSCNGEQVSQERGVFEVFIEKGVKTGDSQTFYGEGDQLPGVKASGDVTVLFEVAENPEFKRVGRCLIVKKSITLQEALCGFEMRVKHLDGRVVVVKSQPNQIVRPNATYIVPREGMPVKGTGGQERGDMAVNLTIQFPKSISASEATALRSVLGPMAKVAGARGEEEYETTMVESHVDLESLAGRAGDDDDDDDPRVHMGGSPIGCAQQ